MSRVRGTEEVRAVLVEWANDWSDPARAERAHDAYMSTGVLSGEGGAIFYVVVDEEMFEELRQRVPVEEIDDG
jgi:hypothetical protein